MVPRLLRRLEVPGVVRRADDQLVTRRGRVPREASSDATRTARPARRERRRSRCAAVDADLDASRSAPPGPRASLQRDGAGVDRPRAGEELREARRDHQRTRQHPRDGRPFVLLALPESVRPLLEALERLGHGRRSDRSHLTLVIPYQPGTSRRTGIAVLRRERPAVRPRTPGARRRASHRRSTGSARSPARRRPACRGRRRGTRPRRRRRRARPRARIGASGVPVHSRRPDRLVQPRLADAVADRRRARPLPGALHRDRDRDGGTRTELRRSRA